MRWGEVTPGQVLLTGAGSIILVIGVEREQDGEHSDWLGGNRVLLQYFAMKPGGSCGRLYSDARLEDFNVENSLHGCVVL